MAWGSFLAVVNHGSLVGCEGTRTRTMVGVEGAFLFQCVQTSVARAGGVQGQNFVT